MDNIVSDDAAERDISSGTRSVCIGYKYGLHKIKTEIEI